MQTESAAHLGRTKELARNFGTSTESCREFDQAAEFAALEGRSIGDALREYLETHDGDITAFPGSMVTSGAKLPILPRAVGRLLRTKGETVSTGELEEIAASDAVLAGRLLGAANSARFGSRCQITRLREAILRIGIPEARKTLLAACLGGLFASSTLSAIWKHSQEVAGAAAELAVQLGMDVETVWTAGLLHDIGRAVLATCPADAQETERRWLGAAFPAAYAETLTYGRDHAEVGADVLREWGLPEDMIEAVRLHHRPESSDRLLPAVLCLAEDLTAVRKGGASEDLWPALRRTIACERAGMSADDFEALKGTGRERTACA